MITRYRPVYLIAIVIVILLGLASRSHWGSYLPRFIQDYAGDTLWALALYLFIAFVRPAGSILSIALCALTGAFLVEFSQLYQADWINTIRHTTLGALFLGKGFVWSDLPCYTMGVCIGAAFDRGLMIIKLRKHHI